MSRHMAPDELLLDYAAGVLPEGPALVVAIHCALDPESRRTVGRLRDVGGALLEREEGPAFEDSALERVLAKLDGLPIDPAPLPAVAPRGFEWAPAPLVPYLDATSRWRKALGGFENVPIHLQSDTHRVEILRLEPGRGLPIHHHVGNEYTIVMQGGFTDATGNYGVGDFAVGPGGHDHEPIADPGEPCIALIVLEKPIVLTGPIGRFFNPLVKRGWL
jgi:putative transcriptional regulator